MPRPSARASRRPDWWASRATPAADELDTGGAAGFGNSSTSDGYGTFPQTITEGTAIMLDPSLAAYAAIGSGILRAWVPGQDDVGHRGLNN